MRQQETLPAKSMEIDGAISVQVQRQKEQLVAKVAENHLQHMINNGLQYRLF